MIPVGRRFEDPTGLAIGHVVSVEPDGAGGHFLIVHGDWGALDWLHALGAAQTSRLFRFHSAEVEEAGEALRLKREVIERTEAAERSDLPERRAPPAEAA